MKPTQLPKTPVLRFFENRATNAIVGAILLIVFAVFLFETWQKWSAQSPTNDYEGRIVDRWADNSGPAQGYQPILILLVESDDGKRFTVKVDSNVYESTKIGMRIKSRSGQIVLIDSNQNDK